MLNVNKFLNIFCSPILLILILLGGVSQVCCVSGTVYGFLYSKKHSLEDVWVECQLCISFSAVTLGFAIIDKLANVHYDILSFLYKFPISKLHREEALEVEATIKLLTRQKVEIRVSEVYSPGLKILASYMGIVLTYTLVAIQFVKDWKQ